MFPRRGEKHTLGADVRLDLYSNFGSALPASRLPNVGSKGDVRRWAWSR
jgi:hypothetical protein